mmetsp:Transcript_26916/g.45434  ORF Transcript_26916/g.45434 Transcript_26916/m.45434 type:complete len:190 (-) Transcript_26916:1523-2092(-)
MSDFTTAPTLSSKGQTEGEIAAEVAKRKAELKAKETPKGKDITVHNASTLTAYDIRQELNRRDAFDFKDDDTVNFRTMLKRLMVELVKDEEEKAIVKEKESKEKMETALEKSKRIREEKKQAALERSRQRQADPEYFKKISDNNVKPVKEVSAPVTGDDEQDQDEPESSGEVDPFQTFVPKGRSKIFIR